MYYPGATLKDCTGIKLGQLIAFLMEVAAQEGEDCTLGSPGSCGDSNLYRVKIGGKRGGKAFSLWMDEGYDENDQFDRDNGLLIKKKRPAKETHQKDEEEESSAAAPHTLRRSPRLASKK